MKVIVAHPQQQHSYRLATALKKADMLSAYVTTVYYRPHTLTAFISRMLTGKWRKKAQSRRCESLDDKDVIQYDELGGLVVLFCHNIPFARRWYDAIRRSVEDSFAEKVATLAKKTNADAVIGYDGCSATLFQRVKEISPGTVCITDMSAANALYLKRIYEADSELKPAYADSLKAWKRIWDPVDIARTENELKYSDCFLCGSSFVQRSLAVSGISADRCAVCYYGVDTTTFAYTKGIKDLSEPLVFIYVGYVGEHKGISYLIEAFSAIEPSMAKLVCVGRIGLDDQIVSSLPSNIELVGSVNHDEVADYLSNSDIMLFPSLGDGFSLSVMEGLSSGLPVVCTENTGSADLIVSGKNGFVIPIQDSDALRQKIEWFLENKDALPAMAEFAHKTVSKYSWSAYYRNASESVKGLIDHARNS